MKKYKKKKKYSLNDRLDYHFARFKNHDRKKKYTAKEEYSLGFYQGVDRGRPLDFDKGDYSKSYKAGCVAGEKAKAKAFRQKF